MKKFNGKRIVTGIVGGFMLCASVACSGGSPAKEPHAQSKNKANITQAHVIENMGASGFKNNMNVKKHKDGSFTVGSYNQDGETLAVRVNGNNVSMEATEANEFRSIEISKRNVCQQSTDYLATGDEFRDRMHYLGANICQGEKGKPAPQNIETKREKEVKRPDAKKPKLESSVLSPGAY